MTSFTNTSLEVGLLPHTTLTQIWSQSLTQSSGDTVAVLSVPLGLVIISMKVQYAALSSGTIEIGDSASATEFLGSTSISSAGTTVITSNVPKRYAAADNIYLTCGGASFSSTLITIVLEYYIDSNSTTGGTYF